jgi:hypothetical protein
MTHTRQYADSEGDFGDWKDHPESCRCLTQSAETGIVGMCKAAVQVRTWESSDGGYEDYQFRCAKGHTWWVDGIDS